jgi:peptidoglycan/xylan/chitin deacetylase (PgdA/CDA1 family)
MMRTFPTCGAIAALALGVLAACGSSPTNSGGSVSQPKSSVSGLPEPGSSNVAKPSASGAANIKILSWAGYGGAVTYSLDDAQPSQIDHFSDLTATGIPFTWYITVSSNAYPGYVATWQAALKRGDELGNHTVNHCPFGVMCQPANPLTPEQEFDDCSTYIQTTLGGPAPSTAAYPFGDTGYEPDAKTRFFLARGNISGMVKPNDASDPWFLPSFVLDPNETAATMDAQVETAKSAGAWVIFTIHSLLPDSANWFNGVDVANVTGDITHAKSIDIWIDTIARVGAYWRAESIVTAAFTGHDAPTTATTWTWTLPPNFPAHQYLRVTVVGGTLSQNGSPLVWDAHGYYEIALDAGALSWSP